ncbi:hypothetical protein NLG97_g3031 [Lecanicillium saksenae]|uniref:Uncharacterized protein n=1 Tax=Lecanicillium saksenae TaxID=468837 RepID=A0ACC1R0Y8_9HYPO|nr:hypothetical protein NLG97_g3031 [Lecanicillium saksenae]
MQQYDLVIIGAGKWTFVELALACIQTVSLGWHGLAMARTYREVHPQASIIILDYAKTIGGTWANERLYPGLKTNNVVGTYEFSDFPLVPEQYNLEPGQHIPGHVVYSYLSNFCDVFGLTRLIRLNTKVESATLLQSGGWEVSVSAVHDPETPGMSSEVEQAGTIVASRLVLATGLTSEPFMPDLLGRKMFKGHIFHAKDFKSRAEDLASLKTIVVIGGNKSAWDVCYSAAAQSGAKVHMVMRRSGGGPSWCLPAKVGGHLKSISAASATRLFTWLDPNPYGPSSQAIRALMNRTWLGKKLSRLFWNYLDDKITKLNAYNDVPGTASLRPWSSTFWMGNSLSIHNYETNWFELARSGQITAHAAQVIKLTETAVHLSDGSIIDADAVICCTGWKTRPTIRFIPGSLAESLGFPGSKSTNQEWEEGVRADILHAAPVLKASPTRQIPKALGPEDLNKADPNTATSKEAHIASPYRLYRFMMPCDSNIIAARNLAVIGAHLTLHTTILAQAQALWITAFFNNKIPQLATTSDRSPNMEAIQRSAFHHTEYQKMRRPKETGGSGGRCPDLVFDSIPYVDLLLADLNLPYHRKSSWYREVTEPYCLRDFIGLIAEWQSRAA